MFEKVRTYLHRRLQRVLLSNPEKAPERIALGMAAIVLLSIVVTYNFLYEKKIREEGDRFDCSFEYRKFLCHIFRY